MSELLSRRDIAALFQCSTLTVIRMEQAGTLTPVRIGKLVRHRREDVQAYLDNQLQPKGNHAR
jgi:excisionase family DNA binding protein